MIYDVRFMFFERTQEMYKNERHVLYFMVVMATDMSQYNQMWYQFFHFTFLE